MATIHIGFSKPNTYKIGAEAISWWMGTEYSHVFIVFEYQDSKSAVFHAAHGSVHFKSLDNFKLSNNIVKMYSINVPNEKHDQLFDRCMNLSGEDYSKLELAKIFTQDLYYSICKKQLPFEDSTGYICSELVGKLLIAEFDTTFEKPTYLLKPLDILTKLQESSEWQD